VETVADIFRNFPDEGLIQCSSKTDSFFNRTQLELERIGLIFKNNFYIFNFILVSEKVCSNSDDFLVKLPPDLELIPQSLLKSVIFLSLYFLYHYEIRKHLKGTKL